MSSVEFNPRELVAKMGVTAMPAVNLAANGWLWTPATLYSAAQILRTNRHPRLAKRLHDLGARWSVLHPEVGAL